MVEKNYRIFCAMNNIPVEEGFVEGAEDADLDDGLEEMAVDDNNVGPTTIAIGDEEEWGGIMEVDDGDDGDDDTPEFFKELKDSAAANQPFKTPSRRKKTKLGEIIREKIRKVIEDDTELADKRASKCDENDFLRLLFAFNSEGIHFA
jgi:18S rRNA (adenine1779-N6/adenine1780-N6)-dimethyltransferase